jgi:3-oxoacyl-[acyl-carrier-protein] synthase-1
MNEPVYITGAGVVSALGLGKEMTLDALRSGRSGIATIRYLQTLHKEFPSGEVKLSNEEMERLLNIPSGIPTTRTSLMGIMALEEALQEAKLNRRKGLDVAFVSGTTVGGMDKTEQYYADFLINDTRNAFIATHDCGACTEMIADYFGDFSMVSSISTACSSAANAIVFGAELIRQHRADIVVAGGSECITKFHLNGFRSLMILDTELCRPFDAHRNGLNLGEGAAYIVLESEESVSRRRILPLALLAGWGNTCDAYHQTASSPTGEGAYQAMKLALQRADLLPADIDYINAHGTGTVNNDLSEGMAVRRLFGEQMPSLSSTKSYTGHTTSASGSIEAVISLLALQHDFIPVSLNFDEPIPELGIRPALTDRPKHHVCNVLSNAFGFGGNDTSLIFSKR